MASWRQTGINHRTNRSSALSINLRDPKHASEARSPGRPHNDLALGTAVRAGTQPEVPPGTKADQRFLEGRRNVHPRGWRMELPLSRGRFHGRHDRFLALGRAGCGGRQALFPESLAGSWSSTPARDQRRRQPFLSEGRGGTEAGAETGSALPLSNLSIPEQQPGAGPSSDQTARQCEPRIPIL
jgi:hypothetical protein